MAPLNKHKDFSPDTEQKGSALILGKIKPSDIQQVAKGVFNPYKKKDHRCYRAWRREESLGWGRNQGNLAFNLVSGSKLVLHFCENLHGNVGIVVGPNGYTAIQILTSV